jgi:hypothetical protein
MLGLRVEAISGSEPDSASDGWNESERALLQQKVASREPFLDFSLSRARQDGTVQRFNVSGEPMFNRSCRFIGYRGIGVEFSVDG